MTRKYITINIEKVTDYDNIVCRYIFKKGICRRKCINDGKCKYHKLGKKEKKVILCNEKMIQKNNLLDYTYDLLNIEKRIKKESIYDLSFNYIKDITKLEYNICNSYYKCKNINLKINELNIDIKSHPKLICYNNDNLLFKEHIKKIKKKKLKKKKYKKTNVDIKVENNIENINFSYMFNQVKEIRNKKIIKHDLNILVLTDDLFIKQMITWCLLVFNENTNHNKVLDKIFKIAIKYNILPFNEDDPDYKIISFQDYKNKLKKLNLKIFDEDIIYIKKYIEFIFRSYHLAYYRTEIIPIYIEKEMDNIMNNFINGFKM